MLNHLSWTSYIEAVTVLFIIYYTLVGLRYYGGELNQLLGSRPEKETAAPVIQDALRYEEPEELSYSHMRTGIGNGPDNLSDESTWEADSLIRQVKQAIQTASGKPFAPAVLIPQLKKLFRANPDLKQSPHRPAINELVVLECERTGTALLAEDEVDQWW